MVTNKRFKRKPKNERISYPEYLAKRITTIKNLLENEEVLEVRKPLQDKLAYIEYKYRQMGNTKLFLHDLENLIKSIS